MMALCGAVNQGATDLSDGREALDWRLTERLVLRSQPKPVYE